MFACGTLMRRLTGEGVAQRECHPSELGAPPFGESRTEIADNSRGRKSDRGSRGGEAVRGQPFLDVHLEHGGFTEAAEVACPDRDERGLGAVPEQPVGGRERSRPAALEALSALQFPQLLTVPVLREGEYIDELAQVPHRHLAPGVRGQQ